MNPLVLAPNLIDHFYRGGDRIAALRGIEQTSEYQPEEWLGSTVSRAGEARSGLASTVSGELLRDLVAADPAGWIGAGHEAASSTSDVGILVKLLDARQRLPVHVHPERAFAVSHLDCPYGKTEAWFVLDTEPGAAVYVGWNTRVDRAELERRMDVQDSEWMLAHMNRVEVERGMGILIPAGTAHAIDGGIFVTEVQEPTDFSILLEWSITTSTRDDSHLGLGFDTALPAVSVDALGASELESLVVRHDLNVRTPVPVSLLPELADPYFRLHQVTAGPENTARVESGFAVALVLEGSGAIEGLGEIEFSAGEVFAVPASFGPWTARGSGQLLVASPGAGWPTSMSEGGIR